jgi:hypothetical protein
MKTTAENRRAGEGKGSSYQIPSSAISIPSNFIFFTASAKERGEVRYHIADYAEKIKIVAV